MFWPLLMLAIATAPAHDTATPTPAAFDWHLPKGFPVPAVPADNPMSVPKVDLGRRLFFDTRLSVTGRYSCASCHDPHRAYTDGRAVAVGATGTVLPRSAMSLVNVAYNVAFDWQQPQITSLEMQMRTPLFNVHPQEIGLAGREEKVVALLNTDGQYPRQFNAAFGRGVSVPDIIKAIAAFERTLIRGNSAFDAYVFEGRHDALTAAARRGMGLFFSARVGCGGCHFGFNFAGSWRDAQGATGEAAFANEGLGVGPVRVPTLRNIALTAPYMHDGRFPTLDAVLDHYQQIGAQRGPHDPRLKTFALQGTERADLEAFLAALTDRSLEAPEPAAR